MADIAPLGFAVDTKALADAGDIAQQAAVKITGVADATDRVGEASKKAADGLKDSAEGAKKVADEHGKAAAAVAATAAEHGNLKTKAEIANTSVVQAAQNTRTQAQEMLRIHDMVGRSLDQVQEKAKATNTHLGGVIPKNLSAQAFERSIELSAAKKMGPTDTDLARQAKAIKQTEQLRKEIEALTRAVDPASAKLMKLDAITEQLGKQYDAGNLSKQAYNSYLDKIDTMEQSIKNPAVRRDTHHSFLGEAGRTLTYGIPRFGREARRLVYEAESEQQGGGLGQGLMGFAKLGAGAAVGMLGVEAFRYITQLPGMLAKAVDESERLQRSFSSFDLGGFQRAEDIAGNLHLSIKGAAEALIEFHNNLSNLPLDQRSQEKIFSAAVSAGRVGGLDEQGQTKSAVDLAQIGNKALVAGSDINTLSSSNPQLANALGQQLGVGSAAGLATLAASGQLTGQKLLDAATRVSDGLRQQSQKIPANAVELEKQVKDSQQKAESMMGDGISRLISRVGLAINNALIRAGGGVGVGEETPSNTPARKPTVGDLTATALNATASYASPTFRNNELQTQLNQVNSTLAARKSATANVNGNLEGGTELEARKRIIEGMIEAAKPLSSITDQIDDLTNAFGHTGSGGGSGVIGVWQQALQIQREQVRQGHDVAGSLDTIVQKLFELKRAQQALADSDELKKLYDNIAEGEVKLRTANLGGYEQRRQLFEIQQENDKRDRDQRLGYTQPSGGASAPAAASAGGSSLATFLAAIKAQESRGRDYDANGNPLRSPQGALFAMQVLPSTAARPGFGIAPAASQSAAEYDRVGTALATALYNRFHGDAATAGLAYHSGLGGVAHPGPRGRQYRADILRRMGSSGGDAATASGDAANDLYPGLRKARRGAFDIGEDVSSFSTLQKLIGDPRAFMGSGAVSGGSVGDSSALIAKYRAGSTPGEVHALELELKLNQAMKDAAPQYRDAIKLAMTRADTADQVLKAEQQIAQMQQQSSDDERRAGFATGSPAQMKALELQLKIEEVRRSPLPADAQERQIGALQGAARSSALLNASGVIGAASNDNRSLRDELSLQRYVGEELSLQQKLLDAKNKIESDTTGMLPGEVALREEEADAIIRANDALAKQLDTINSVKGAYRFALDSIGGAWSNMFADMERHGKLHVNILLRGIEDGFYGMLDRLEQKLVISPLMTIFDKLLNGLTNSLLGGSAIALPNLGAMQPVGINLGNTALPMPSGLGGSARGNVFGARGLVPYAGGDMFNTPTRFAMGGGGTGIAGEGPGLYEAIMPLKRGPDGRLGVSTHGRGGDGEGGGTVININDHRGSGAAPVEVQERETGNGRRAIDITLRDAQRSNVSGGRIDADMRGAYGISRPATRR